jgi:hypothetical protein
VVLTAICFYDALGDCRVQKDHLRLSALWMPSASP